MKVELVIFDIAGTTVSDEGNVNKAFSSALAKSGYPVPVPAVNHVMGYRKLEAIDRLLKKFYPSDYALMIPKTNAGIMLRGISI